MASDPEEQLSIFNEYLLKCLKCPVCLKYMTGRIKLCSLGHSICNECKVNVHSCPVCRAEYKEGRNFIVEDMRKNVIFPCDNKDFDCTEKLLSNQAMVNDPKEQSSIFNEGLLKCLECPVCFKYMTGRMGLCFGGHSICDKCKKEVRSCPLCREEFSGARNYMAEDMRKNVIFPCENNDIGCTEKLLFDQIVVHRLSCSCRIYKCFAGKNNLCSWKGRKWELQDHVSSNHSSYLCSKVRTKFDWVIAEENYVEPHCEGFLMSELGEQFWYIEKTDLVKDFTSFSVQYIGPAEKATEFCYSLDFVSKDGHQELFLEHNTFNDLQDFEGIHASKECLGISNTYFVNLIKKWSKMNVVLKITRRNT